MILGWSSIKIAHKPFRSIEQDGPRAKSNHQFSFTFLSLFLQRMKLFRINKTHLIQASLKLNSMCKQRKQDTTQCVGWFSEKKSVQKLIWKLALFWTSTTFLNEMQYKILSVNCLQFCRWTLSKNCLESTGKANWWVSHYYPPECEKDSFSRKELLFSRKRLRYYLYWG